MSEKIIEKKWNRKEKISKTADLLIHLIGYTIVMILVASLFDETVHIEKIFYGFISVLIIFVLNKTVKPVLVWLTLPLTAMTLGLFYPVINMLILLLTDFILGKHFELDGPIFIFIVSIVITLMNAFMDNVIIDGIIKGGKRK